jgi:hypothetical protein
VVRMGGTVGGEFSSPQHESPRGAWAEQQYEGPPGHRADPRAEWEEWTRTRWPRRGRADASMGFAPKVRSLIVSWTPRARCVAEVSTSGAAPVRRRPYGAGVVLPMIAGVLLCCIVGPFLLLLHVCCCGHIPAVLSPSTTTLPPRALAAAPAPAPAQS